MKKILSFVLIIVIIVSVCAVFSGCSVESKMVGTWICDETHRNYPDIMTLNSDGTGTADGNTVNWYINEDELHLNATLVSATYTVSFSGNTLFLDDYTYHKN